MSDRIHPAKRANRLRIWEATYAAAFVRAFNEATRLGVHFDQAVANKTEQAMGVADEAIAQLDQWIEDGNLV